MSGASRLLRDEVEIVSFTDGEPGPFNEPAADPDRSSSELVFGYVYTASSRDHETEVGTPAPHIAEEWRVMLPADTVIPDGARIRALGRTFTIVGRPLEIRAPIGQRERFLDVRLEHVGELLAPKGGV